MQPFYAEPAPWLVPDNDALRDLAWLLTGPCLPLSDPADRIYLPKDEVGAAWWRQIAADCLSRPYVPPPWPDSGRLGRYAETLFADGLQRLPGHRLLLSQYPVREQGRSVGEFDFVLQRPDGSRWHIELTVKFYLGLALPDGRLAWIGPGLRDNWARKEARLFRHQLRLSATPAGQAAVAAIDGEVVQPWPCAWLRGRLFLRQPPADDPLYGWWRCLSETWPRRSPESGWRILARRDWMAPRRADLLLDEAEVRAQVEARLTAGEGPLLVAEYQRDSGQELVRGFVVPDDWPERAERYAAEFY